MRPRKKVLQLCALLFKRCYTFPARAARLLQHPWPGPAVLRAWREDKEHGADERRRHYGHQH